MEPVCIGSSEASAIYRRSLCLLLAAAAHTLFPGKRLVVGHSLGHGYYYTLDTAKSLSSADVKRLQEKMNELVKQNHSIRQSFISYKETTALFEHLNMSETRKQLNFVFCTAFAVYRLYYTV